MARRKKARPARHTGAPRRRRGGRWLLAAVGAIVVVVVVWAIGSSRRPAVTRASQNMYAPVTRALTFPASVQTAAPEVRELYQFVAHRPDVAHYIPCFCGCWRAGHKSSYDCFMHEVRADGTVLIDDMGFT